MRAQLMRDLQDKSRLAMGIRHKALLNWVGSFRAGVGGGGGGQAGVGGGPPNQQQGAGLSNGTNGQGGQQGGQGAQAGGQGAGGVGAGVGSQGGARPPSAASLNQLAQAFGGPTHMIPGPLTKGVAGVGGGQQGTQQSGPSQASGSGGGGGGMGGGGMGGIGNNAQAGPSGLVGGGMGGLGGGGGGMGGAGGLGGGGGGGLGGNGGGIGGNSAGQPTNPNQPRAIWKGMLHLTVPGVPGQPPREARAMSVAMAGEGAVVSGQPQTWPPELRLMISDAPLLHINVLTAWVKQHRPAIVHFHGLGQAAEMVRNMAGMMKKLGKVCVCVCVWYGRWTELEAVGRGEGGARSLVGGGRPSVVDARFPSLPPVRPFVVVTLTNRLPSTSPPPSPDATARTGPACSSSPPRHPTPARTGPSTSPRRCSWRRACRSFRRSSSRSRC
ncbi:uncharacterized protein SCHCODRAFT_02289762 [Schizophyllum commune H4-8]|uniref:uncharacterized protein n=1 Tax=Schizophyllum commune (strain H4-8 / FGSC 9210) TaxID=578458 RepID=UPI00215EA692|nr:uncharacterized protein SCHCODRAFT_02289762 [Schizophyllum commune H4-8]KAI5892348.1 hypothetical protein SCHCODRAFT_02289762 [Schizophyllum commune H4-8]